VEGRGRGRGKVGGIRRQIKDGENGFLVNTVDEAAQRIIRLLKDARPALSLMLTCGRNLGPTLKVRCARTFCLAA
jgi:glycosyltransferase involved in cell wall biosynthesis